MTSRYLGFIQEWLSTAQAPTVRRNRKQPWWRAIVHSCPDRARPAAAGDASHDPSMIHVVERQWLCRMPTRYGELTDFSCPEQWVRSHRNVQPRRRALWTQGQPAAEVTSLHPEQNLNNLLHIPHQSSGIPIVQGSIVQGRRHVVVPG